MYDHYLCANEQKITHREAITKAKEQQKEEMFAFKNKCAIDKIE